MNPDTHLGENARHREVSDDQATPYLYARIQARSRQPGARSGLQPYRSSSITRGGVTPTSKALTPEQQKIQELEARINRLEREKSILKNRLPGAPRPIGIETLRTTLTFLDSGRWLFGG